MCRRMGRNGLLAGEGEAVGTIGLFGILVNENADVAVPGFAGSSRSSGLVAVVVMSLAVRRFPIVARGPLSVATRRSPPVVVPRRSLPNRSAAWFSPRPRQPHILALQGDMHPVRAVVSEDHVRGV